MTPMGDKSYNVFQGLRWRFQPGVDDSWSKVPSITTKVYFDLLSR
jgi:hypothetical protein